MKRICAAIFPVIVAFCFLYHSPLYAEKKQTYTVQEGDTLWDICEKVYGDSDLWPKLWQMNPFITNPHLLKPGDTIQLFEAASNSDAGKEKAPATSVPKETMGLDSGLDVSPLTEVKSMGYLSRDVVQPWGKILSGETERVMLAEGDVIFVEMDGGFRSDPGKVYTVYENSSLQKDPVDGAVLGYVINYLGKIVIKEHVRDLLYKAEVAESFRTIRPGDLIIPDEPISSCVRLLPADSGIVTHIAAVKDQLKLIGQYTVVYLPAGYVGGVRRGNLFEIVENWDVKGDGASEKGVFLPERILGHLLVLESRPDTATAVVISVKENVSPGATVRGLNWVQAPDFFPELSGCTLE